MEDCAVNWAQSSTRAPIGWDVHALLSREHLKPASRKSEWPHRSPARRRRMPGATAALPPAPAAPIALHWIGPRVGGPIRRRIHRARQHRVRRDAALADSMFGTAPLFPAVIAGSSGGR